MSILSNNSVKKADDRSPLLQALGKAVVETRETDRNIANYARECGGAYEPILDAMGAADEDRLPTTGRKGYYDAHVRRLQTWRGLHSQRHAANRWAIVLCHGREQRSPPFLRRSDFPEREKYFHRLVYAPLRCSALPYTAGHHTFPNDTEAGIDIGLAQTKLSAQPFRPCTYEVVMRTNSEPSLFDQVKPLNGRRAAANGIGKRVSPAKPFAVLKAKRVPFAERPTCTVAEACDAAGLGRTKLYESFKDDAIESFTVGRRRLVRVPSLLKFLGIVGQ